MAKPSHFPSTSESETHDDVTSNYSSMDDKPFPGGRLITQSKKKAMFGVTLDGLRRFDLPKNPHSTLSYFSLSSFLVTLFVSAVVYVGLSGNDRSWIMLVTIVSRVAYNGVAGWVLSQQSQNQFLTRWITSLREHPFARSYQVVRTLLSVGFFGEDGDIVSRNPLEDMRLAPGYPAWVLFRRFVIVVEACDVVAFTLAAIRFSEVSAETCSLWWFPDAWVTCVETPSMSLNYVFVPAWIMFVLGFVIIVLSLYSKFMAHEVAGDFSWYWADFFFRVENELTYQGIFELFPHPMYTVGYAWTYGCALLSRSYYVLALALAMHMSQMLFLWLVENPHIERLYGAEVVVVGNGFLGKPTNVFVIKNFDIFRADDISLVMMLVFLVLALWMGSRPGGMLDSNSFFLAHTLFWRISSMVVISFVLVRQSKTKFWTRHFAGIGCNSQQAFENWKRLWNMLQSLRYISFMLFAARVFDYDYFVNMFNDPGAVARLLFGTMLIGVSLWSFNNCYAALGDFGWFYGDFFMKPPSGEKQLTYSGIYRYLNNPDVYLGHLWVYGVAFLCDSRSVALVGFISHCLEIMFLQIVEKPHVRAVYKHRVRDHSSPLETVIKRRAHKLTNSDSARFFANWVRHPISTGALAPSSQQLAEAMCDHMGMSPSAVVVELGPGTGPFTEEIFRRIDAPGKPGNYLGFELNEEFYTGLVGRFHAHKDDFLLESAECILKHLKKRGFKHADCVVSGLPWAIFPRDLQEKILAEIAKSVKPGGKFSTFAYLQGLVLPAGQSFKRLLSQYFDHVERSPVVWKNIPPAFVYRCTKKK